MPAVKEFKMYINGEWCGPNGTFPDFNPATHDVWANIPNASREDAKVAIDAAAAAHEAWAALPHTERAKYLWKAADILEERKQDAISAIVSEAGGWVGKGGFETGYVASIYRAAAAAAYQVKGEIHASDHHKLSMIVRQPLGVVSVIAPWNFPMLLSSRGIAVAMAVGNTVVLKPSEETSYTGGLFIAEIFEEAGLPNGVLNVITCSRDNVEEVGDEMISNPLVKAISFTGSTAVGRQIAAKAGYLLKKVSIEAGGKDVLLVLDDADIGKAVSAATFGTFMHQGQICMSVERVVVDNSIADEFIDRFVKNAQSLGIGDPSQLGNVIGPIINQKQLNKIHAQVKDAVSKGATILTGGTHDGPYYYPTLLTNVTPDMDIYNEETFGPVAIILKANGVEDAIRIANDSDYGLASGVMTRDEEKGLDVARRLETGMVHINDSSVNDEPHVPFGGVKGSGVGRHDGQSSIDTFTELRWITLERGGRHYPPPFYEKTHNDDSN
ncbi:MAG: aldehyde dehydrogenase family protein [Candidatus Promineifilaceae bacterium]|nr:aldehyde dehydrogenase family protein [Candidatus Promineifilaceae bacterium]